VTAILARFIHVDFVEQLGFVLSWNPRCASRHGEKKSQIDKFGEAAREADADESEDAFNATLKNLAEKGRKEMPSSADAGKADASHHQKPKSSCKGD
jgi:hypothetical protein